MGQPITVTSRPGTLPEVMHFELNRSLTGMDIERYKSGEEVTGTRPPDELARRLFVLGVDAVTVYSSVVTATASSTRWSELRPRVTEAIEQLFIHYAADSPAAGGTAADPITADLATES